MSTNTDILKFRQIQKQISAHLSSVILGIFRKVGRIAAVICRKIGRFEIQYLICAADHKCTVTQDFFSSPCWRHPNLWFVTIAFYSILPIYPNIRRQSLLWLRRVLLLQLVNIRSKSACWVFDKIIYWQTTQPQKKLLLWASGKTVARNCTFIKKKTTCFLTFRISPNKSIFPSLPAAFSYFPRILFPSCWA